jgi:tetratricopeptide (TPR) repeat protein
MEGSMKILFSLSLVFIILSCWGFSFKMQYVEKSLLSPAREMRISLADAKGEAEDIDYSGQLASPRIFLLAEPLTRDEFISKDVDLLKELKIIQNEKEISVESIDYRKDASDKTQSMLFHFLKSELSLDEEFQVKAGDFVSDKIRLDERFRREYHEYHEKYELGRSAINKLDYVGCYRHLEPFLTTAKEVRSLSFYDSAIKELSGCTEQQVKRISSDLDFLKLQLTGKITRDNLVAIDSLLSFCNECETLFSGYAAAIDSTVQITLAQAGTELEELYQNKYAQYLKQVQSDFIQMDYRSLKFHSFIGALTQILLDEENVLNMSEASLDIGILSKNSRYYKKIQEFGFTAAFGELLELVKYNIFHKNFVFDETVMVRLENLQENEPEPYYMIYRGINNLLTEQYQDFWQDMNSAMYKCTDSHLLRGLELLILFNDEYIINLSNSDRAPFEEGLGLFDSGKNDEARHKFELIKSLYPDLAVSYYLLASLAIQKNDTFTAYFEYENVVRYKPEIITAYEYYIQQEYNAGNYSVAEQKVKEVIRTHPAWKLNFLFANILSAQKKYQEAAQVLETRCIETNKNNYEEFILLGDVYKELGNKVKARESYLEAGRLDPTDAVFREKIEALNQS